MSTTGVWKAAVDLATGKTYYWNTETKEVSWTNPDAPPPPPPPPPPPTPPQSPTPPPAAVPTTTKAVVKPRTVQSIIVGDVTLECSSRESETFDFFKLVAGVRFDEEEVNEWANESEEEVVDEATSGGARRLVDALSVDTNLAAPLGYEDPKRITPLSLADYAKRLILGRSIATGSSKDDARPEYVFQNPPLFVWSGRTFGKLGAMTEVADMVRGRINGTGAEALVHPNVPNAGPSMIVPISILEAKLLFIAHSDAMEKGAFLEVGWDAPTADDPTGKVLNKSTPAFKRFLLRALEQVAYAAAPLPFFDAPSLKRKSDAAGSNDEKKVKAGDPIDFKLDDQLVDFLKEVNRLCPSVASDSTLGLGEFVLKRGEVGKGGFHCFVRKQPHSYSGAQLYGDNPMPHDARALEVLLKKMAANDATVDVVSLAKAYARSFHANGEVTHSRPFYVANEGVTLEVKHVLDAFASVETNLEPPVESSAAFYKKLRADYARDYPYEMRPSVAWNLSDVTCFISNNVDDSLSMGYYPTLPALIATRKSTATATSSSATLDQPVSAAELGVSMVPFVRTIGVGVRRATGQKRFTLFDAKDPFPFVKPMKAQDYESAMVKMSTRDAVVGDDLTAAESTVFAQRSPLVATFVPAAFAEEKSSGVLLAVHYGELPVLQSTIDVTQWVLRKDFAGWFAGEAAGTNRRIMASAIALRNVTVEFSSKLMGPIDDKAVVVHMKRFKPQKLKEAVAAENAEEDDEETRLFREFMTDLARGVADDDRARKVLVDAFALYTKVASGVTTHIRREFNGKRTAWPSNMDSRAYDATEAFSDSLAVEGVGTKIGDLIRSRNIKHNRDAPMRSLLPTNTTKLPRGYARRVKLLHDYVVVPSGELLETLETADEASTAAVPSVRAPVTRPIRRGENRGRGVHRSVGTQSAAPGVPVNLPRVLGDTVTLGLAPSGSSESLLPLDDADFHAVAEFLDDALVETVVNTAPGSPPPSSGGDPLHDLSDDNVSDGEFGELQDVPSSPRHSPPLSGSLASREEAGKRHVAMAYAIQALRKGKG